MKDQEAAYHVVYLSNHEQITIRTALMDYCAGRVDQAIRDFSPDPADWTSAQTTLHRDIVRIMQRYENAISCMTSIDAHTAKKGNLFYFDREGMAWILGALISYDESATYGDSDKTSQLQKNLEATKKHVTKAADFMYTQEEVRKILREEGAR